MEIARKGQTCCQVHRQVTSVSLIKNTASPHKLHLTFLNLFVYKNNMVHIKNTAAWIKQIRTANKITFSLKQNTFKMGFWSYMFH